MCEPPYLGPTLIFEFLLAAQASSPIIATMLAKVCSAAVNGIDAYPVEVEVNAGWGETNIVIVVNKTLKHEV